MTAKISSAAAQGWRDYCAANGITVTALIEVSGRVLANGSDAYLGSKQQEMIQEARRVDLERRQRRRP